MIFAGLRIGDLCSLRIYAQAMGLTDDPRADWQPGSGREGQ